MSFGSGIEALVYVSGAITQQNLQSTPHIFVTDGSIHQLLKYQFLDKYYHKLHVIGDLDSVNKEKLPQEINLIQTPDQNLNDFQKCFQFLNKQIQGRVIVFMEHGSRLDHLLCNMDFMSRYNRVIQWHCGTRICYVVGPGQYSFTVRVGKKEIGMSSFSKCDIRTKGFKWQVDGILFSSSSNQAQAEQVHVSVRQGKLFLSL